MRAADHVFQVIVAVVVGDFLVRFDFAHGPDEDLSSIGVCLGVRIAGVVGVARDIAPGGAVDRDPRIDFVEIAVAAPFKPACFLRRHAWTLIFGDFLTLFDRPRGEQAEAGERAADPERSSGHFWDRKRDDGGFAE